MDSMEKNIREIYSSFVHIEKYDIPLYKSLREFVASFYKNVKSELPLIFLSEKAFEKLIFPEGEYYEPNVKITLEDLDNYLCVKEESEYPHQFACRVYVIKKENTELYTIRGLVATDSHCFAPNDIERETFQSFIADTCVGYYYENVKFDYPLYIS